MSDKNKKVGRPKSLAPKNIRIGVRVDEDLKKDLEQYSKENNLTLSETIIKAIKNLLNK